MKARIVGLPGGGVQLTLDGNKALSVFVAPRLPSHLQPNAMVADFQATHFRHAVANALGLVAPGSDVTVVPPPEPHLAIIDIDGNSVETEAWSGTAADLVDDNSHDTYTLRAIASVLTDGWARRVGIGRELRMVPRPPP